MFFLPEINYLVGEKKAYLKKVPFYTFLYQLIVEMKMCYVKMTHLSKPGKHAFVWGANGVSPYQPVKHCFETTFCHM